MGNSTAVNVHSHQAFVALQDLQHQDAVKVLRLSLDPRLRSAVQPGSFVAWLGAVSIPTPRLGQWPFLVGRMKVGHKHHLFLLTYQPERDVDGPWWWWSRVWHCPSVEAGMARVEQERLAMHSTGGSLLKYKKGLPWNGVGLDIPLFGE